jgi:type IV pilus assembly protein PilV
MLVRQQGGFALLEGLITVVIFSIGIIGLVSIQAALLKQNQQSGMRAQASYFAEEIIGLASVDPNNAACYIINSGTATCSSTTAQSDASDWNTRAKAQLPSASTTGHLPTVSYNSTTGIFSVTLNWKRTDETDWHQFVSTTVIKP